MDGSVGELTASRGLALCFASTWTLRRAASFRLGTERHLQLCCDCRAVWEVTGVKKEKQQEGPVLAGRVPAVNRKDDL